MIAMKIMDKFEMLEQYISHADEILDKNDISSAEQFVREVVAVYGMEISDIKSQLDTFSIVASYGVGTPDYLGDVKLLKAKLMNYYNNLRSGLYKTLMSSDGTNIHVNQEMHSSISISLEQVAEAINRIPETELSAEEKVELTGKLASLWADKDKKSKWDKAKEILKWIGDKSVQVGIAALPYITQSIQ